mgnify:CR=1 FL=1|tara:strand:+ start:285 stop:887 length:603 start_codon:yes stop_codon:yes gene_type:complete
MKVIAFDLGNVIFGFDYMIALKKIEGLINVSSSQLLKRLLENRFGLNFEKGLITPEEFFKDFKDEFQIEITYQEFVDIWCEIFFPHPEVIELVKKLKVKYRLFLISNINKLHFEYLEGKFPEVFALFSELVLSFQEKAIKPEEKIYQALKERAKVDFKDIIYIDDRADLITAATALGLISIKFENYPQLISDLKEIGINC